MKQLSRFLSTYSPDLSGVCSALYELGGLLVIHDASGCNSTYTTFDEPRWYDMDSMVFCSGLVEIDAILGNDEKLIGEVVTAARDLHPAFISIAGSPIPMMAGVDIKGIAGIIERRSGIPTFGFPTNGLTDYCSGAGMAFEALAERFCRREEKPLSGKKAVNIIGATPLDFSIKGNIPMLRRLFEERGYEIVSLWAMGSNLEEIAQAGRANTNVVVSASGLPAARRLRELLGTPMVVGLPIGTAATEELFRLVDAAASDGQDKYLLPVPVAEDGKEAKTLIIGEQVYANSLRCCLRADYGFSRVRTLSPLFPETVLLLPGDLSTNAEEDMQRAMADYELIIADPMYRPLAEQKSGKRFISMPHEAFSSRMYRDKSPVIIGKEVHAYLENYLP